MSVSWAVDYWLEKGIPASKLTMGLPTYGRGWTLQDAANSGYNAPATGPSPKGISTKADGYLSYYEILEVRQVQQVHMMKRGSALTSSTMVNGLVMTTSVLSVQS